MICTKPAGAFGFPAPLSPSRVSVGALGLQLDTVPLFLAKQGSSSRELRASSASSCSVPTRDLSASSAFHGVRIPLIAASVSVVVTMSAPAHRLSALDVSHVLDGLIRLRPSWVCFTPQPRPGFALQGVSLRHSRDTSSVPVALSSVGAESLLPVARQRHDPSPRPQGFSPCQSPLPDYGV